LKRKKNRGRLLLGFFAWLLGVLPPCQAWSQENLGDFQGELKRKREEVQRLEAKEKEASSSLDTVARGLAETRKRAAGLEAEILALDKEMDAARARYAEAAHGLAELEVFAAERLAAYYKLSRVGLAPVLFSAGSFYDFANLQTSLSRVLAQDKETFDNLARRKKEAQALAEEMEKRRAHDMALRARLKKEIGSLGERQSNRETLLAGIRKERKLAASALAELEEAARRLDKELRDVEDESARTGNAQAGKDFPSLKGALAPPVKAGVITTGFGKYKDPRLNVELFHSGVKYKAALGEPFTAVAPGRVVYAAWFKGYGNMIIIDHGAAYFTVSAHAGELFKKKGDPVVAGEVLGTVGDSGALSGSGLYFEVRHHDAPLDPAEWIRKGNG
jgi:septal ring factor EnvC (AmiA/AmiB activator)